MTNCRNVKDCSGASAMPEVRIQAYTALYSTKDIAFKDIGTKDIYQIEVPVKVKVPSNWTKMTGTKDKSRYWNREVEKLVGELKEARELKDQAGQVFRFKVCSADLALTSPH